MCVKDSASHTGYTFYACAPLAKMLKQLDLFLGGYVNKDLENFLVALVIFKCFVVVRLWPVVLCCDEMLSLAEFKVELIMVQTRHGQGQRQATHTTSTYQGVLHAMPAKRLALHKLQDCVGGWVAFFCCTQQDTDPSHPLTKPDTFAFVISLRSQAPNLFPFPLYSNSHSYCYPPPLHSSALPPLVARVGS